MIIVQSPMVANNVEIDELKVETEILKRKDNDLKVEKAMLF